MAAPLVICTKEEQNALIFFLVLWSNIYRRICAKNGESVFVMKKKCLWMDREVLGKLHKCQRWRRGMRVNGRVWNGNILNLWPMKRSKFNYLLENWCLQFSGDSQGSILEQYREKGSTINGACSSEMLTEELKPELAIKRRGLLSKVVVILHDNARRPKLSTLCKNFVLWC